MILLGVGSAAARFPEAASCCLRRRFVGLEGIILLRLFHVAFFVLIRGFHPVFTRGPETEGMKRQIKNQRASARYSFVTGLRFRAYRQAAITCSGSGQSADMSAGGIAIEIGKVLETGVEVELVLDWPGLYHGRQRMRLFVWGEVVRSDESVTAVRIVTHEFREAAAKAVA